MKKVFASVLIVVFVLVCFPLMAEAVYKTKTTKGYTKKNGTYVHSYTSQRHYKSGSSKKRKK